MRWRLFLTLTVITAAFCFMLLTAVTDFGEVGYATPSLMVSATTGPDAGSASSPVAALFMPAPPKDAQAKSGNSLTPYKFDPHLKPKTAHLFVSHSGDLVASRMSQDNDLAAIRAKKPVNQRLKSDDHGWFREELALVTAYCPCRKCCGSRAQGITSIGKSAWSQGLAADPVYLDYGTRVSIPGYGLSVIDDTGGAMRRHWREDGILHIDVRMTYHYDARQWGKQYLKVRIYQED